MINILYPFNIIIVPRVENRKVESFGTNVSQLIHLEDYEVNGFLVELIFKPLVPDNVTNWRVFDDDVQIIQFLTDKETFKDVVIDDEIHELHMDESSNENIDPKSNFIPQKDSYLEKIFYL